MGTRSLTKIYNENGEIICTMYKQFDGYVDGLGSEIFEALRNSKVVNGFNMSFTDLYGNFVQGDENPKSFNGSGCLAAWLIKHFKEDIGGIYLLPNTVDDAEAAYFYHISVDETEHTDQGHKHNRRYKKIRMKIVDCEENILFDDLVENFDVATVQDFENSLED